jgi:hypothetical protein
MNTGLFPHDPLAKLGEAQRWRRTKQLREFLRTMPQGLREQIVVELSRELIDLGLQPDMFLEK